MVILLVPEPIQPDLLAVQFTQARQIINKTGLPVIDLLDTFRESKNLIQFRVSRDNLHANARGHEMFFKNLYHKITQEPKLTALVLGAHKLQAVRRTAPLSLASLALRMGFVSPRSVGKFSFST